MDAEEHKRARGGFGAKDDGDSALGGAVEHANDRDGEGVVLEAVVWGSGHRVGLGGQCRVMGGDYQLVLYVIYKAALATLLKWDGLDLD